MTAAAPTTVPSTTVPSTTVPSTTDVPAAPARTRVLVQRAPNLEPPTRPVADPGAAELHPASAAPCDVPHVPRRRPLPVVDPAAHVGAARALRMAIEVEEGRRNPAHLLPIMTPLVVAGVQARARRWVRGREHPARLHVVHVQAVDERVVEVFSRVSRGPRDHAVTARLERRAGGWHCTALRL